MKRVIYIILVVLATVQCSGGNSSKKTIIPPSAAYERYKNLESDDTFKYFHFQTGLFALLSDELPKDASEVRSTARHGNINILEGGIIPRIFISNIRRDEFSPNDTLRFNWKADTIIYAQHASFEVLFTCEMISTIDYIYVIDAERDFEFYKITHECQIAEKYRKRYIRYLRNWDPYIMKLYFPSSEETTCGSLDSWMLVGRIIIDNGKITRIDSKNVEYFDIELFEEI